MKDMSKLEIHSGRAGYNSVSFTGERYQSISRFQDSHIKTAVRLKRKNNKIIIILSTIPFVRSFSMVIDLIIDYWKRFLVATIVLFLVEFLLIRESNFFLEYTIQISTIEVLFFLLILAGIIIKSTSIGQYHAAEHMTLTAYESGLKLTLENVRKQPRTHQGCGTNLVVCIVLCFSVLSLILDGSVWLLLLAWAIGFELWKGEPKIIWHLIVVIGKAAQYLLFTSKPQDKHLIVAIEAITRLEEKELANENNSLNMGK